MPVDADKLMQDKRLVEAVLWFYIDGELQKYRMDARDADTGYVHEIPTDGFLCGKGRFADGCYENYGGDGWLVVGYTKYGLLCQTTGGDRPDPERYSDCQFARCKLAPSAILHVAFEEAAQWR